MKELEHEVVDLAFETEKHHMRFSREGTPLTYPVVQRDSVTGDPPVVGRDVSGGEAEDARDGATRSGDLKGSARHHTVCDDHGRADARRHTRNPKSPKPRSPQPFVLLLHTGAPELIPQSQASWGFLRHLTCFRRLTSTSEASRRHIMPTRPHRYWDRKKRSRREGRLQCADEQGMYDVTLSMKLLGSAHTLMAHGWIPQAARTKHL